MSIEHHFDSHCLLARARGKSLDASNIGEFRQAMTPLIEQHDRIILDLAAVEFVDSAGVGTLISCLRAISERRGELRLCGLNRPVQALFDLMRMHRIFEIHPDPQSARESLA